MDTVRGLQYAKKTRQKFVSTNVQRQRLLRVYRLLAHRATEVRLNDPNEGAPSDPAMQSHRQCSELLCGMQEWSVWSCCVCKLGVFGRRRDRVVIGEQRTVRHRRAKRASRSRGVKSETRQST